jgi:hypothetical protein
VRALSGVIPCIAMQGAGLRGRVGVVAERRLGGERSGAGIRYFRVVGDENSMRDGGERKGIGEHVFLRWEIGGHVFSRIHTYYLRFLLFWEIALKSFYFA